SPHAVLRSTAVDALVSIDADKGIAIIGTVLTDTNSPDPLRQQMAESLGRIDSATAREMLVSLLKVAPEELAVAVVRSLAGSREGARVLLTVVEKGIASPRLLQDRVVDERMRHAEVEELPARLAKLLDGLPPGDERLRQLIATRKAGFSTTTFDVAQGEKLFEKNCAVCHQLNGKGKKVGPELDGIGLRGLDRLLEDVLDPNRNVDANFRASAVALENGQLVTGLVVREEGQVLVVIDDKGQEQRVSISEIDGRRDSKLSPMPANVSELMNETEFGHLMAFLLDQRRKADKAEK
ncbi:MAG: c-type cytochrome, partial [Planctomycetaceae bacterium]